MQTDILDSLPFFHFRLHSDISKDEMIASLSDLSINMYIGGYETEASRNHWQLSIHTVKPLNTLREEIKKKFTPERSQYSISAKRTTVRKLATYLLKEGNYIYKGFDQKYIEELLKLTFKNSKKSKEQFYQLDDKFLLDPDMTYQSYIKEFKALKLEHRQRGRDETMLAQLDMLLQRKDPAYLKNRENQAITKFQLFYLDPNY